MKKPYLTIVVQKPDGKSEQQRIPRVTGVTDPGATPPMSNNVRAYNYVKQNGSASITPAQARRMRKAANRLQESA